MTRRLIDGDFTTTHELKVYRDSELGEYIAQVRCKTDGHLVASYHTDDKEDAKNTGRVELERSTQLHLE